MLLLLGLPTLPKRDFCYSTLLDLESKTFSTTPFLLMFAAARKTTTKPWIASLSILSTERTPRWRDRPFLAAKLFAGETINNFFTRLQKLAEHCYCEAERDNQVRDRTISFIKDRNLKAKLYREEAHGNC